MILPTSPETTAALENSDVAAAAVAGVTLDTLAPVAPTRVGKIARLPRRVREELNQRLEEGEAGNVLVEWLNGRPEVNEVLRAQFEGRAINAQNLSDWRQGGFRDWCRHRAAWDRAALAREEAEDFEQLTGVGRGPAADKLNGVAMAALSELFSEAMAMEAGPKRQRLMLAAMRELGRLRRAEAAREMIMIKREDAKALRPEQRDGEVGAKWKGGKDESGKHLEAEEQGRGGDESGAPGGEEVEKMQVKEKRKSATVENAGEVRRGKYDYAEVRRTVQMLKGRGKKVPAQLQAFLEECEAAGRGNEKG